MRRREGGSFGTAGADNCALGPEAGRDNPPVVAVAAQRVQHAHPKGAAAQVAKPAGATTT